MNRLCLFYALLIFISGYSQQPLVTPFIPEMVQKFPNVRDLTMSPDGNELMFTAQSIMGNLSTIIYLKKENDSWGHMQTAPFSGQYFDLEPCFSPDGLKLYFVSSRPLSPNLKESKDFDIWYVERTSLNEGWSGPKHMGHPINTAYGEFYPSLAENGNLYFTRDNTSLERKDDIYMSEYHNGTYLEPHPLPESINSKSYEYNAYIAPDESYLIFGAYNREDGYGSGDLYISYKTGNNWSVAKNMGNIINSNKMDYCPFMDTKNGMLYFTSKRDNTKTQFNLPLSIEDLFSELHRYDNGLSRLYGIAVDSLKVNK